MESKVVTCIALISESEMCFCKADEYKVCPKRIRGNLNCVESVVRVTPIDRSSTDADDSAPLSIAKGIEPRLRKLTDNFKTLVENLDRIKK